jgi:tryptophanyl-tRNA synthetase
MERKKAPISITGDRPTGALHIGHYVGSLKTRLAMQDSHDQYILIADLQAMTDNSGSAKQIRDNILEVALDYLAVGLSPEKNNFVIQSMVPELTELTVYLLNFVSTSRLSRNPTVKQEIKQKQSFKAGVPAGFLIYPVSQAADILAFRATHVPVGEDQIPMIEQTNEIVRTFNHAYSTNVLQECVPILSSSPRLCGTDGDMKMGKSLNNAIFLRDTEDTLHKKIMGMFTDPNHVRVADPGRVEGNPVFSYLDVFDSDVSRIQELKAHYSRGGLGDVKVKQCLFEVLNELLKPIREKRKLFEADIGEVQSMLFKHSDCGRERAQETLTSFKRAMGMYGSNV